MAKSAKKNTTTKKPPLAVLKSITPRERMLRIAQERYCSSGPTTEEAAMWLSDISNAAGGDGSDVSSDEGVDLYAFDLVIDGCVFVVEVKPLED